MFEQFEDSFIGRYLSAARQWLLPDHCAFCARPCDPSLCCEACRSLLPRNRTACWRCAAPQPAELPIGVLCAACLVRAPAYSAALAPFLYEFPIDSAIKALKYRRQLFYLPVFADCLAACIAERFADADGLVAVPLHRYRHVRRGFNQAYELAKLVTRRSGLPTAKNVFRIRATATQSGLTAAGRRQNVKSAFAVSNICTYQRPIIIDDVLTTGATCAALAQVLLDAGAEEVRVATLACARLT